MCLCACVHACMRNFVFASVIKHAVDSVVGGCVWRVCVRARACVCVIKHTVDSAVGVCVIKRAGVSVVGGCVCVCLCLCLKESKCAYVSYTFSNGTHYAHCIRMTNGPGLEKSRGNLCKLIQPEQQVMFPENCSPIRSSTPAPVECPILRAPFS